MYLGLIDIYIYKSYFFFPSKLLELFSLENDAELCKDVPFAIATGNSYK